MDTDVLVAGLRSRTGASRVLLQAAYVGVIQPLISVATFLEYEAVLTRTEQLVAMRLTHAEIAAFLDVFLTRAEEVSPYYNHSGIVRDPNDDKFVSAAINGGADAIVTFNVRDYVPRDGRVSSLESGSAVPVTFCGVYHGVRQQLCPAGSSLTDGGR
jgi:putative PIN family toxin of toxin-antitoxin system